MSKITADEIKIMLQEKHYDESKHMIAFEVADGTGSHASRWADAVSMELWPSNDYKIVGYEIKVSRSDWLSELKQPDKSQAISQFCDQWYLVAPKDVLGIDELPKGWGWMQATKNILRVKIRAPQRDSSPPDKSFMASFLRKAVAKYTDKSMLNEMRIRISDQQKKHWESYFKSQLERFEETADEHKKMIADFQKRSGINIYNWTYKKTADAIKALTEESRRESLIDQLSNHTERQKLMVENNMKIIEALKDWPKEQQYEPEHD